MYTMKYQLNCLLMCNKYRNVVFRTYAGHSKWHNIKQTKQAMDTARSLLFNQISSKMKAVVAETKIANPAENTRLAQLVDQAKKANMPMTTLNRILERLKSNGSDKLEIVPVRGPGRSTMILHISTDNLVKIKMEIASKLRKHGSKFIDSSALNMFTCASYVIASKDCTLDQAIDDAIHVNAEDVEEVKVEDKTYFKFRCKFLSSERNISQLINKNYSIISIEDTCIPNNVIELSEEELQEVTKLKDKLSHIVEISKVEDNIFES